MYYEWFKKNNLVTGNNNLLKLAVTELVEAPSYILPKAKQSSHFDKLNDHKSYFFTFLF